MQTNNHKLVQSTRQTQRQDKHSLDTLYEEWFICRSTISKAYDKIGPLGNGPGSHVTDILEWSTAIALTILGVLDGLPCSSVLITTLSSDVKYSSLWRDNCRATRNWGRQFRERLSEGFIWNFPFSHSPCTWCTDSGPPQWSWSWGRCFDCCRTSSRRHSPRIGTAPGNSPTDPCPLDRDHWTAWTCLDSPILMRARWPSMSRRPELVPEGFPLPLLDEIYWMKSRDTVGEAEQSRTASVCLFIHWRLVFNSPTHE